MNRIEVIKAMYGNAEKEPIVLENGEEIHPWYIQGVETLEEALLELGNPDDRELEMIYDRESVIS